MFEIVFMFKSKSIYTLKVIKIFLKYRINHMKISIKCILKNAIEFLHKNMLFVLKYKTKFEN